MITYSPSRENRFCSSDELSSNDVWVKSITRCRLSMAEAIEGSLTVSIFSRAPSRKERFFCRWTWLFVFEVVFAFVGKRDFRGRFFFSWLSFSFKTTNSSSVMFSPTLLLRREPRERWTGVIVVDDWRSRSDNTLLKIFRTAAMGVDALSSCESTRQVWYEIDESDLERR